MTEEKTGKIEREYVIPIREVIRSVPRYKKSPKAIREIKKFLIRHMQIRDGDENKVKLGHSINEAIWARGIKRTLHKIKVKVVKENGIVYAEMVNPSQSFTFKKANLEKRNEKAAAHAGVSSDEQKAPKTEKTAEAKADEKEKIESTKDAEKAVEKAEAKEKKHTPKKETVEGKQKRQGSHKAEQN